VVAPAQQWACVWVGWEWVSVSVSECLWVSVSAPWVVVSVRGKIPF
jgi:hypothetical protein